MPARCIRRARRSGLVLASIGVMALVSACDDGLDPGNVNGSEACKIVSCPQVTDPKREDFSFGDRRFSISSCNIVDGLDVGHTCSGFIDVCSVVHTVNKFDVGIVGPNGSGQGALYYGNSYYGSNGPGDGDSFLIYGTTSNTGTDGCTADIDYVLSCVRSGGLNDYSCESVDLSPKAQCGIPAGGYDHDVFQLSLSMPLFPADCAAEFP